MAKYRVASVADLDPESLARVEAGGLGICLARLGDGTIHALADRCTHEDYSLSDGDLWDSSVECPMHGSRFDVRTGKVTGLPAVIPARVFPVSVEDGEVYVEV